MRALFLLLLACCVFGGAGYFTWLLFIKPEQDLRMEKSMPPPTPPPDPTVPEYNKRVELHKAGNLLEAREAFEDFIERHPESTRIEEAKNRLGEINTDIFLSPMDAPGKQTYTVKSGDVLSRVASRLKTTPELLSEANDLTQVMLKIGQKLTYTPHNFSLTIDRKNDKVVLLNEGRFFAQFAIIAKEESKKKQTKEPPRGKQSGTVSNKMAWHDDKTVNFMDPEYKTADHWVVISVPGHTLYSHREAGPEGKKPKRPPSGLGLAPEDMQKLAVLVNKGTPVIIE
ncbi:MAG: LysM peptidoglycan-binding domain-containing protein [Chthoniobacteraceae bacterium]